MFAENYPYMPFVREMRRRYAAGDIGEVRYAEAEYLDEPADLAAIWERRVETAAHEAWVAGHATALRQDDAGVYVNFVGDEGQDRVREAYPGETWDRLAAVKRRYDPGNLFRRNQNIPPAP
jgi:Berberine and berberine like